MSAPIDRILNNLDKVRKSGNGWEACCPSHDDHEPSLSISEGRTGKVLVKCWAGCSQKEVISALRDRGLWTSEPRVAGPRPVPLPRISGPTPDESRRMRQGARLYKAAKPITDFPDLVSYIKERGLDPDLIMSAGGRAGCIPRADLEDKAPPGWVKGEMADALLFPIYDPEDILKSGERRLMGCMREWPWGRDGGPRSVKAALGKTHAPHGRGAGGFLIGEISVLSIIYVVEGQLTGFAVHTATGAPVLVLFTAGGMAGIGRDTIRGIAEYQASVCIAGDCDPSKAGEKATERCAERIDLTGLKLPVTISIPEHEKTDWFDVLVEHGPEATAALMTARERPPARPKPKTAKSHSDEFYTNHFLIEPDLSGGPMGPEPPPFTEFPGNLINLLPWRRRADAPTRPILPSREEMNEQLLASLPAAITAARTGKPVLIMVPPGGGKTHTTLATILKTRIQKEGENGEIHERPLDFVWTSPTKKLAGESKETADKARIGRMWDWDGRMIDGLCKKQDVVGVLQKNGRGPNPNACRKCEFGKRPKDGEPDNRCQFQKNLDVVPEAVGIFGQHGIIGKESTLLKTSVREKIGDGEGTKKTLLNRDLIVIDEGVPTFEIVTVTPDDISAARLAGQQIELHIAELRQQPTQRAADGTELEEPFTEEDYREAREWVAKIDPQLKRLSDLISTGVEKGKGLHAIDPWEWRDLIILGKKIPEAALAADATALEKCKDVFGQKPIVPMAWIQKLVEAIGRITAWIKVDDQGTHLTGTIPTDLWTRYLKKGGIMLDASSVHQEEIAAVGGVIIDLQCAQPQLKTILYASRLHGKGDGGKSASGRKTLEREAADLRAAMGDDPDVVVITHKALALYMKDERVRHWGTHKGHNDWKNKRRLILWGLPLMNAHDQIIGYKTYRAAMKSHGIIVPDWNGERVREWAQFDDWNILPAAKLPAVKEARDWLLMQVGADVFQAIGRLRAIWATEPVTVEIYGFLPIQGFGMHVDEIRMEGTGRLHAKVNSRSIIAAAVVDIGESMTRKQISDYVYSHGGGRVSNSTIDNCLAEIKIFARRLGLSLAGAAMVTFHVAHNLLCEHNDDALAAAAAADTVGVSGAAFVNLLIYQGRQRSAAAASGAQRAGP